MAGEALNMNQLAINNFHCKLKDLCFKTAIKEYTQPLGASVRKRQYHRKFMIDKQIEILYF